ncbi:MAG TPA: alpha/beta hydrolase [Baekduia sp.]
MQPTTIVLVHGAFAESASWNAVAERLHAAGHPVVAAANPLRGVAADAAGIGDLVRTIDGPVVLAGHSYGGAVISNVAADAGDVVALVYVAAFAPEAGESCVELSQRFPGSTLGDALRPVPHGDGTVDLLIARDRFHDQFCADLSAHEAGLMSITQRPVAQAALEEPSGPDPLWRHVPSSFVIGVEDRNIPAALQRALAQRANALRTVEVPGASHAVAVSHPAETADLILDAAALRLAA